MTFPKNLKQYFLTPFLKLILGIFIISVVFDYFYDDLSILDSFYQNIASWYIKVISAFVVSIFTYIAHKAE